MAAPILIIVDDSDSRVTYNPPSSWRTLGSQSEYSGTTHAGLGTMQFAFNGTSVSVYGTISANVASTNITCTVDGVAIHVMDPVPPSTETLYHQLFCNGTMEDDKEHTLEVTVNPTEQQQFFLDYITYEVPTTSTSHLAAVPAGATASLLVDGSHSDQVAFNGPGDWATSGANGECHGTNKPDSYATFSFQGTQVAVFGTVTDSDPSNTWLTTYSIDDGAPVEVNSSSLTEPIRQTNESLSSESKIQLHQISGLPDGNHTLKVDFVSGNREFWLDYFVYTPSPSLLTAQDPKQTVPAAPANTAGGSSLSPKQIIGIATGSVLALILLLASIILVIRLKRSRRKYSRLSPDGITESGLAGTMGNRARPPAWGSSSTAAEASRPTVTFEPLYASNSEMNGMGAVQSRPVSKLPPPYTSQ